MADGEAPNGNQLRNCVDTVIEVTKLDGEDFYVSPHQIEFLDETPDTVLHMISGKKLIVQEELDTVIDRIVQYRQKIGNKDLPPEKLTNTEGS